ncbi:MAG: hypothetical protein K8S54_17905 [Spirochaetia bacterium]|nr:hypothetical protein [Spirochaetia bacterium]
MKTLRVLICLLACGILSNCFQIMHFIDLKENGTMEVQWSFRFSKALEEMGKGEKKGGISEGVEKGKKEIPEKLQGLVKNLKVEAIQTDFDSGIQLSFSVPDFSKVDAAKLQNEEFPYLPTLDPKKNQLIFHFQPMKKDKKEEPAKPEATKPEPAKDPEKSAEGESPDETAPKEGMDQMGQQIGKLFLSSVRYQIILGRNLVPVSASVKQGDTQKKLEIQRLGEQNLIDLPLFALFGDKEQPFDLVIQLK